jgi:hypothetical protein
MDFSISDFKEKLAREWPKGQNIVSFIQAEIDRAKDTIAGISNKTNQKDAFVSEAVNRIDTYIFQLQELLRLKDVQEMETGEPEIQSPPRIPSAIAAQLDKYEGNHESSTVKDDPLTNKENPQADTGSKED